MSQSSSNKEETLNQIKDLGAAFFTPDETSVIMQDPKLTEKSQDPNDEYYQAYYSGRLQSEFDLRKSIIQLAKSGSSPAQAMAMDLLTKSKIKM